jgi:hypothetical protein
MLAICLIEIRMSIEYCFKFNFTDFLVYVCIDNEALQKEYSQIQIELHNCEEQQSNEILKGQDTMYSDLWGLIDDNDV